MSISLQEFINTLERRQIKQQDYIKNQDTLLDSTRRILRENVSTDKKVIAKMKQMNGRVLDGIKAKTAPESEYSALAQSWLKIVVEASINSLSVKPSPVSFNPLSSLGATTPQRTSNKISKTVARSTCVRTKTISIYRRFAHPRFRLRPRIHKLECSKEKMKVSQATKFEEWLYPLPGDRNVQRATYLGCGFELLA